MEIYELSVGNTVFTMRNHIKNIMCIEKHENEYQIRFEDELHEHINLLKPIPLTEEWLLKFGFKKSSHGKKLEDLKKDYEEVSYIGYYEKKWCNYLQLA